jgi:hypothetical protein
MKQNELKVNALALNGKPAVQIEFRLDGIDSELTALNAYFGARPGDSQAEFLKEVQALAPDAKTELATLAAAELGCVMS